MEQGMPTLTPHAVSTYFQPPAVIAGAKLALSRVRPILRTLALSLVLLVLGACAEPWPEQFSWPGQDPYVPELAYCYINIGGRPDCFAEPQPGQNYRQVGRAIIAPH